jgi:flagellar P-ring protein FlgI
MLSANRAATSCLLVLLAVGTGSAGVRLKDITDLQGARANQLYGFGLVIGLGNTGGKSLFTQQVATDMLQRMWVGSKTVQDNRSDNLFKSANISAVMVTAEIGPFSRRGSRIDVTVSVLDDAQSLLNGELLLTPLRGVDGVIYAVAQGSVIVGGFSARGQAATVQKNQVTNGKVVGGATVEHEARGEVMCNGQIRMLLRNPDHTTASAIAAVVNHWLPGQSLALDAGTVLVDVPPRFRAYVVTFLGDLGNLEVEPDIPARVVINERTGTVVTGENVKISTVGIAHGNLAIVSRETPQVSQPAPFSNGRTTVVPRSQVGITEQGGLLHVAPRTISVGDLARSLNALGVTPRDLISIFQALKKSGALQAELVTM